MPRKKVIEPVLEPEEPLVEPIAVKVKKPRTKKVDVPPLEIPSVVEPVKRKGTPKPRKQSRWMTALKEYNKNTEKYTIPRKGTSEYDAVQKLMEGLSV
jgi:hypothetical protein